MSHDPVDLLVTIHALQDQAVQWRTLALGMAAFALFNGALATWALVRLFGGAA